MSRLMSRRGLLWGAAGLAGTAALAGSGSVFACSRRSAPAATAQARARLAAALPEVFAPDRLAGAQPPVPGGAAELLRRLERRPGLHAALRAECPAARRALVRHQIAEDFAAGAVQVVDRLVVSQSECLIAALCLGAGARPA